MTPRGWGWWWTPRLRTLGHQFLSGALGGLFQGRTGEGGGSRGQGGLAVLHPARMVGSWGSGLVPAESHGPTAQPCPLHGLCLRPASPQVCLPSPLSLDSTCASSLLRPQLAAHPVLACEPGCCLAQSTAGEMGDSRAHRSIPSYLGDLKGPSLALFPCLGTRT